MDYLLEVKTRLLGLNETPLEELMVVEKQLQCFKKYATQINKHPTLLRYLRKHYSEILEARAGQKTGIETLYKRILDKMADYEKASHKAITPEQKEKLRQKFYAAKSALVFLTYVLKQENLRKAKGITKKATAMKMQEALNLGIYDIDFFSKLLTPEDHLKYGPKTKSPPKSQKKKAKDSDSDSDYDPLEDLSSNIPYKGKSAIEIMLIPDSPSPDRTMEVEKTPIKASKETLKTLLKNDPHLQMEIAGLIQAKLHGKGKEDNGKADKEDKGKADKGKADKGKADKGKEDKEIDVDLLAELFASTL